MAGGRSKACLGAVSSPASTVLIKEQFNGSDSEFQVLKLNVSFAFKVIFYDHISVATGARPQAYS